MRASWDGVLECDSFMIRHAPGKVVADACALSCTITISAHAHFVATNARYTHIITSAQAHSFARAAKHKWKFCDVIVCCYRGVRGQEGDL